MDRKTQDSPMATKTILTNTSAKTSHILLVEDMMLNRNLVTILLEREGYKVTATDNALDALQAMTTSHFDGILLDIRMPGMDGLTAVRVIRSCEQGHLPAEHVSKNLADLLITQLQGFNIPIIVMTASNAGEEKTRGLEAGADQFLAKPFTPEKLLFAMEQMIQIPQ